MTISIEEKIGLAQVFSEKVQETLTAAQFREAVYLNKVDGPHSPVCHTHDYCDANMLMAAAWEDFFGQAPDVASEADAAIWNEAWAIAKAADFFA